MMMWLWLLSAQAQSVPTPSYAAVSVAAAQQLGVEVALTEELHQACELIYSRKYPEAKKLLGDLTLKYPDLGIGPIGEAIIYQSLMFENEDYRYERQYQQAAAAAQLQIEAGLQHPGREALEYFFLSGIQGLDAVQSMRKVDVLPALNKAFDAMHSLEKVREYAPTFTDLKLCDGMFIYWRSVIATSSKLLPDGTDRRAEGIELIKQAEKEANFLGPGSSLALAYSYIESHNYKLAVERCQFLRAHYPDNLLNNMTLARVYSSLRHYDDAIAIYEEIKLRVSSNQRVYFEEGVVYSRMGRYTEAKASYLVYIKFPDVPINERSSTQYRLGLVCGQLKQLDEAHYWYEEAIKTNGNNAAKKAIDRMDRAAAGASK